MTPTQYYKLAESMMDAAMDMTNGHSNESRAQAVQCAQVYATLAAAGVTAQATYQSMALGPGAEWSQVLHEGRRT